MRIQGGWAHRLAVLGAVSCACGVATAEAATVEAASCSESDVSYAIDSAGDGDTVLVPAGECAWDTGVTVPDTKGVEVIGAGVASTRVSGAADPKFTIHIAAAATTFTRISGIEFFGADAHGADVLQTTLWGAESTRRYRIDHCSFLNHKGVRLEGNAYGLIDHCAFYRDGDGLYGYWLWVGGQTGKTSAATGSSDSGYQSWSEPLEFGSEKFHYVEDCTFTLTAWAGTQNWTDGRAGGKVVLRHSTVQNGSWGFHDACTAGMRGMCGFELYGNSFQSDDDIWSFNLGRGGTGVIYDNSFRSVSVQAASVLWWNNPVYRHPDGNGCQCPWANDTGCPAADGCGGAQERFCIKDTTPCADDGDCTSIPGDECIPVDGHDDGSGYPCRDQLGTAAAGTGMVEHPLVAWNNSSCIDPSDPLGCTPSSYAAIRWNSADDDVVKPERNVIDYDAVAGTGTCEDGDDNDQDGAADASDATCAMYWDASTHQKRDYLPLPYPHPLADGGGGGGGAAGGAAPVGGGGAAAGGVGVAGAPSDGNGGCGCRWVVPPRPGWSWRTVVWLGLVWARRRRRAAPLAPPPPPSAAGRSGRRRATPRSVGSHWPRNGIAWGSKRRSRCEGRGRRRGVSCWPNGRSEPSRSSRR